MVKTVVSKQAERLRNYDYREGIGLKKDRRIHGKSNNLFGCYSDVGTCN